MTNLRTIKVILTGATGMVGEGVLLECLAHPAVEQVLSVSRRPSGRQHDKLKECIVPDFLKLEGIADQFAGYDACFYCAGISSRGMSEAEYSRTTYEIPLHFAQALAILNPQMIFGHISGSHADSSEKGRIMWARVKGRAENALMQLGFQRVYNFRPGLMRPTEGQRNVPAALRALGSLYPMLRLLFPQNVSTMHEVGMAMINSVLVGYPKSILEVRDIIQLAHTPVAGMGQV